MVLCLDSRLFSKYQLSRYITHHPSKPVIRRRDGVARSGVRSLIDCAVFPRLFQCAFGSTWDFHRRYFSGASVANLFDIGPMFCSGEVEY